MHDEVNNHFDSSFIDMAAATLRGPAGVPTRTILLGNPGGPAHPWLQARYGIPAGYPEPGKASRFWSEDLGKHTIFASFTAGSNQHVALDQFIRTSRLQLLMIRRCWMHGCMGGWMWTFPVHSSDQALASGEACVMCDQAGSTQQNCAVPLSVWTGVVVHRPWPICACPIPMVHRKGASGCWMSSMWRVQRPVAKGIGLAALI